MCTAMLGMLVAAMGMVPVPADLDCDTLRTIPVQFHGRYPPLDTLARGTVAKITGREAFGGHDPVALFLAWQFSTGQTDEQWMEAELIKVEHAPLKRHVGLDESRRRFSRNELLEAQSLQMLFASIGQKQREEAELTALEKQAADVYGRINALREAVGGMGMLMVPAPDAGPDHQHWVHPADQVMAGTPVAAAWTALGEAFRTDQPERFKEASQALVSALAGLSRAGVPSAELLGREVHYNQLRPFRLAWVLMVVALVVGLIGLTAKRRWVDAAALLILAVGFGLHTYGIALRWQIAGRAPLANMYESLLAMSWGVELFALVFIIVSRMRLVVVVAGAVGGVGLILADLLPLESAIGPIPPVLRNTAWLTIHVVTIMLAYGALALAMGIGHVQLGVLTLTPDNKDLAGRITRLIHGIVLVGVLFLTAGVIFGSIWANASWGRYWGWDPKETWSLITLFGYLGMLHARYVGWLRQFGTALFSIAAFMLVVMTYYGVNYVLGAGLHSYGFGAGGLQWVLLYVGVEALILVVAAVRHHVLTIPSVPDESRKLASPVTGTG